MKKLKLSLLVCLLVNSIYSLNLSGPSVYVVTPSSKPSYNEGRSAPFYYHNWMRRMDTPDNLTTTTSKPKIKTPDLIFAEFESGSNDMQKSIRKLLEKERIDLKTTTTQKPIILPENNPSETYPDESEHYNLPVETDAQGEKSSSVVDDYYSLNNNVYNSAPAPVYLPSTTRSTTTTSTTTMTTSTPAPSNVENIWHIIDSEKYNQHSNLAWEEIPLTDDESDKSNSENTNLKSKNTEDIIDDHFALPGFATNPGNDAENESRAIRTEPNIRFPYVNLKTFQMKKPVVNSFSNSKKGNNMFTSLDNFKDIRKPVRGEVLDGLPIREPIDRYNPAQPYLPDYGPKTKQSSPPASTPMKAVANLIPPPPPPQPANDNLLPPTNYESFPPYAPPRAPPPLPSPPAKPSISYQPPVFDDSSDNSDDGPTMDLGYRYKPSSSTNFAPTVPPSSFDKPFTGYSYNKPPTDDISQPPSAPFKGYSYKPPGSDMDDTPQEPSPPFKGYSYKPPANDPPPSMDEEDKPEYHGYHHKPVGPPEDHPPASYGHHSAHSYHSSHDSDYPELIYNKPQNGMDDMKSGDSMMKGAGDDMKANDMDMAPPPPPPDMKPDDDSGFPHDFPGDFKYHDLDDHDHYHHYHHHPHTTTTTTTTTEMPRVNRYSYYYLGKKLYYLPLYFSVYFIVYVGALIIKAVLRHKIVYPNSWRPNDMTASFFTKRSVDSLDMSNEKLHEVTRVVTKAIVTAAEKYMSNLKET